MTGWMDDVNVNKLFHGESLEKKLMATLSTTGIGSELNLACKELNFSESLEKKIHGYSSTTGIGSELNLACKELNLMRMICRVDDVNANKLFHSESIEKRIHGY